jgi:hypothetical protein
LAYVRTVRMHARSFKTPTGTHIFAKTPIQKLVRAEIAAVAVTRSRLISCTQSRYSVSVSQRSGLSTGQTQVPPDWEVMFAFTAMM